MQYTPSLCIGEGREGFVTASLELVVGLVTPVIFACKQVYMLVFLHFYSTCTTTATGCTSFPRQLYLKVILSVVSPDDNPLHHGHGRGRALYGRLAC